jgi:hypothetical protein
MGYRGDAYAVQINTAQGWSDGVSRPTLCFVAKTKISGIVNNPPPATGGCTPEEITKAKQEEWDRINAEATATHEVTVVMPPRP